ncbi:MAG: hypothetical protein Kow00121_31030 [Elainellaceae cyanobacterium]
MSDEFVELPTGDDRPVRSSRRSVRLFLIGKAEDVDKTIAELHSKQFGEAGLWSKPLPLPEMQQQFTQNPAEVMRVYKRYVTP